MAAKRFRPAREAATALMMPPAEARRLIQACARRVERLAARRRHAQRALDALDDELRAAKRELRDVTLAAIPDPEIP